MMVKIPIVGWMLVTERVHRVIVFLLEIIGVAPVTDSVLNCWCKFPKERGWNPFFLYWLYVVDSTTRAQFTCISSPPRMQQLEEAQHVFAMHADVVDGK